MQVLATAVRQRKVGDIVQMIIVESAVMFFEVIFLYREMIDAITPWIAQQTGGEVRLGLAATLFLASFGWRGVRGMSWFLFGRFGTPALLAILARQTLTHDGSSPITVPPLAPDFWRAPVEALKKETAFFHEEAKRMFELVSIPVMQLLAAALNFAGELRLWHLFAVTVITGVPWAFNNPVRQSEKIGQTLGLPGTNATDLAGGWPVFQVASFADLGRDVLVLSCDFRNPTLHKLFQLSNKLGLADALAPNNGLHVMGLLTQRVPETGVRLVASGTATKAPGQLLASDRMKRILAEARADRHLVDVIETTSVSGVALQAGNLLASHHGVPVPDGYREQFIEDWAVVSSLNPQVITWNTNAISEEDAPRTWDDFLEPEHSGCVLDAGSQSFIAGMITDRGYEATEAWVEGFLSNDGVIRRGLGATARALAAGELDCAVYLNLHSVESLIVDDGAPLAWHAPDPTFASASSVHIYKHTVRPHAAALLANWILDSGGADIVVDDGRLSVHPEVELRYERLQPFVTPGSEPEQLLRPVLADVAMEVDEQAFQLIETHLMPNLVQD
jgi:ABC-type Fe3+ transport system substrate-binding protein